jgi:hypothetical protein
MCFLVLFSLIKVSATLFTLLRISAFQLELRGKRFELLPVTWPNLIQKQSTTRNSRQR